eukprot:6946645-Heterocapsa_arctica.AAC.1
MENMWSPAPPTPSVIATEPTAGAKTALRPCLCATLFAPRICFLESGFLQQHEVVLLVDCTSHSRGVPGRDVGRDSSP